MYIYCPTTNYSQHTLYRVSQNQSLTTQYLSTGPQQKLTTQCIPGVLQIIIHHTIYICCPTINHSLHNVYLLSNKQSLTTQCISTLPQPINRHTIYIFRPTTNLSPHNIYLLSHNQSLTTQYIPNGPQSVTHHTNCIYNPTTNHFLID